MQEQQPQRSGQSATAKLPPRSKSTTALHQFMQWCRINQVSPPRLEYGRWVRSQAPNKSSNNKSLSVMVKGDCIHVKDWTADDNFTFFDSGPANSSRQNQQRLEIRRKAEEQQAKQQAEAASISKKLWREAIHAPVAGYFLDKGLGHTHGAKWHQRLGCWIVLLTDISGKAQGIQKIYNSGHKLFIKGSKTTGGMVVIGSLGAAKRILVCEGFSTGCTLHELTGQTVVCALTCNNIMQVCTSIRKKYPSIKIVICADDDRQTPGNPGRTKAVAAANKTGAHVAYPRLCDGCSCSDFNDAKLCSMRVAK